MMLLLDCYDAAMLLGCRGDANPAVNKREQVKELINICFCQSFGTNIAIEIATKGCDYQCESMEIVRMSLSNKLLIRFASQRTAFTDENRGNLSINCLLRHPSRFAP